MTLEALELLPRGADGWGSGLLTFGERTTLLLGPNGAGKTPIIKALSYALGHPVELPPLVRDRCASVRLRLGTREGAFQLERQLTPSGVEATGTDTQGSMVVLRDERALSEWVLPKLDVSLRPLSGKNGEKVAPYVSVAGPMFLVGQDTGWTTLYVPFESSNFVKDQREEVMRWMLDVPAKHRATDKSEFLAAKVALAGTQEQIAFKRRGLEELQRELGEDRAADAAARLQERCSGLEADLARAYSVLEGLSETESVIDVRLREADQRREQVAYKLANAKRRQSQVLDVRAEVNAELGALEQNEVAADAFRAFCGNENCQFFRKPEESYGRRILYLKDQLKDFEPSAGEIERELAVLQQQLSAAEASVQEAAEEKKKSLERGAGGPAVAAVQAMTRELADIGVRLDRLARIARERRQLDALINQELRARENVTELKPTRGGSRDNTRLLDARQHLAATFKEWMLALHTPNVPADASFDEELRLTIGGERFGTKSSHSGSTRTRIILAFHAAMVETSLLMGGVHPRLLVLDAPRQHELDATDLRSYITRFYEMSAKQTQPVQLVFSASDPAIISKAHVDAIWEPLFKFEEGRRFLGPLRMA